MSTMIDFYTSEPHYVEHMRPTWDKLPAARRGTWWHSLRTYDMPLVSDLTQKKLFDEYQPTGPIVVASYADLKCVFDHLRHIRVRPPVIFSEHGVGFGLPHRGYVGAPLHELGWRTQIDLYLYPNETARQFGARYLPHTRHCVVGCPKLDWVAGYAFDPPKRRPVVAISFHWGGHVDVPESDNAFAEMRDALPLLANRSDLEVLGHAHPLVYEQMSEDLADLGIKQQTYDFDTVMRKADLYVVDSSSTAYEFLTTGKPVVLMNAAKYRRGTDYGIRFWRYSDVGPQVDTADELLPAINAVLRDSSPWGLARETAVRDLYPNLGTAAEHAAAAITNYLDEVLE